MASSAKFFRTWQWNDALSDSIDGHVIGDCQKGDSDHPEPGNDLRTSSKFAKRAEERVVTVSHCTLQVKLVVRTSCSQAQACKQLG